MMTSAQVEMSGSVKNYTHLDDDTLPTYGSYYVNLFI